jgi:hypothetical protein
MNVVWFFFQKRTSYPRGWGGGRVLNKSNRFLLRKEAKTSGHFPLLSRAAAL